MTLAERLRSIVDTLPPGSGVTLPVDTLRHWLDAEPATAAPGPDLAQQEPESWRSKLWTCPADTRLGVRELAEALDRSPDWCYRAVSADRAREHGREPLPCQKLDGSLVFTVGAVRRWLAASEKIVNAGPSSNHARCYGL